MVIRLSSEHSCYIQSFSRVERFVNDFPVKRYNPACEEPGYGLGLITCHKLRMADSHINVRIGYNSVYIPFK